METIGRGKANVRFGSMDPAHVEEVEDAMCESSSSSDAGALGFMKPNILTLHYTFCNSASFAKHGPVILGPSSAKQR